MSEAVEERFEVTDDRSAEWCVKKIKEAEADRAMWKAHYAEQMKKVDESADSSIAYFTGLLEQYFGTVPHKATKTQESYSLPGAKLVRKVQQPKFTVDDEAVVPWLKGNGMDGLIKVKESADWAGLKKAVQVLEDCVVSADGEVIPGITVEQRPDVFKVEME